MSHVFYDTSGLSLDEKRILLLRAFALRDNWWVDKLDCRESFHRQKIAMGFDEILGKLDETCHFTFIHRKWFVPGGEEYLEIGFCTMRGQVDYFLWLILDIQHMGELSREFNLHPKWI